MPDSLPVYVIDDDAAVRDAIIFLLNSSGIEARGFSSGLEFLEAAPSLEAGCVLTDVRMPGIDGIELLRRLTERGADLPVIVMTGQSDVPTAIRALKAGALDFIEKPFQDDTLLEAVKTALEASRRARLHHAEVAVIEARQTALTAREREVMDCLVAGMPNKVIAHELGASPRTVEVHRARVMEKMEARSLSELVRMVLMLEREGRVHARHAQDGA